MKSLQVVFIFVVVVGFMESTALDDEQVFRLSELNSLFDTLHQNFDFRINKALRNQTEYLRILNAQLFSRIGFVTDEIKLKEEEVLMEIRRRGEEIDDPEADCIIQSGIALENAIEYAGYNINGVVGEAMYYVNRIEHDYFYPLIHVLQLESNIMQWSVKSELRRTNPVSQMPLLVERIESDYEINLVLYDIAIRNIAREIENLDERMNEVKASMFPQLNSVRDYFIFTANVIKDNMPLCEA